MGATEAGSEIVIAHSDQLPERPRKHVQDIVRLLHELDGLLPDELLAIQQLISTASNTAIRKLAVCHIEGFPSLTRWQVALIDKLNADAGIERDAEMMRLLESLLLDSSSTSSQTSLQTLQQHLFAAPEEKSSLDNYRAMAGC